MKKLLDANIILRYLLEDDLIKARAIEDLLKTKNDFVLTDVTVSEIIWVLISYYNFNKNEIVKKITSLLLLPNIESNKFILLKALYNFDNLNIDWADAYLAAYGINNNIQEIYSYDKHFNKIKEIVRKEPPLQKK